MINNVNLNYNYNTSNFKQDKNIDLKINKYGVAVITGEGALSYRGKNLSIILKYSDLMKVLVKKICKNLITL